MLGIPLLASFASLHRRAASPPLTLSSLAESLFAPHKLARGRACVRVYYACICAYTSCALSHALSRVFAQRVLHPVFHRVLAGARLLHRAFGVIES